MTNRYSITDGDSKALGEAIDNWIDKNVSGMDNGCGWTWSYAIALLAGILMAALIFAAIAGGEGSDFANPLLPHETLSLLG